MCHPVALLQVKEGFACSENHSDNAHLMHCVVSREWKAMHMIAIGPGERRKLDAEGNFGLRCSKTKLCLDLLIVHCAFETDG